MREESGVRVDWVEGCLFVEVGGILEDVLEGNGRGGLVRVFWGFVDF